MSKIHRTVSLEPEVDKKLLLLSEEAGIDISSVVNSLIRDGYLSKEPPLSRFERLEAGAPGNPFSKAILLEKIPDPAKATEREEARKRELEIERLAKEMVDDTDSWINRLQHRMPAHYYDVHNAEVAKHVGPLSPSRPLLSHPPNRYPIWLYD